MAEEMIRLISRAYMTPERRWQLFDLWCLCRRLASITNASRDEVSLSAPMYGAYQTTIRPGEI